jgi:cell division protein FtsI (penicillin-binding protein 3)
VLTDRLGLPLAYNLPRENVIVDLFILNNREKAAPALAPLLQTTPEEIFRQINRDDRRIVPLAKNVETECAEKIRALKIRGVGFEDAYVRTYPQGTLAGQLLGHAGADTAQGEGLERSLDKLLRGVPGSFRYYRDAAKRLIALDGDMLADSNNLPRDGLNVSLTIVAALQEAAEEQLAHIQEEFDPKGAVCILMDVTDGSILAMASTPGCDPNKPEESTPDKRRCRSVTDFYEPGSTFKTIFAATALERNRWRRNETIFCENGAWRLGERTLHDSHAYGTLTFDDVISKSSNIGAAKICTRFTLAEMYDIVASFGFGQQTGLNFPGESRGMLRQKQKWTVDSRYSVAMGHEIGVTPIQLITAYAAVVNGGTLLRPQLVKRVTDEKGQELYALKPIPVRRVISERTSKEMREVLARVVQPGGTGVKAFLPEWQVIGKTGTTKKIDPATHSYSSTLYIGSFCGVAPFENPKLACLVTVDEPRKAAGYYGGTVACPAAKEMLRKGLTWLNVPPRSVDEQKKAVAMCATAAEPH